MWLVLGFEFGFKNYDKIGFIGGELFRGMVWIDMIFDKIKGCYMGLFIFLGVLFIYE